MPRTSRAVILTEAGPDVGLGHIGRCVALVDALEKQGCSCTLVIAGEAPGYVVGPRETHVRDWYSAQSAVKCVEAADIAVIDSYKATAGLYATVADAVPVLVCLDDTARLSYPRGIVVNGNPEAAKLGLVSRPDLKQLLGVEYQLLRSEFAGARPRSARAVVERILIVAGGGHAEAVREAMVAGASATFPYAVQDTVDSPRTAAEMRDAMLEADLAVSAAGQTLYELAATGTPTVAVCVADNQVAQARAFEGAGALRLAGIWGETQTQERLLDRLSGMASLDVRAAVSTAAHSLVDGLGATRVARVCVDTLDCIRTGTEAS